MATAGLQGGGAILGTIGGLALVTAAALGGGAALLRALGVLAAMQLGERLAWSFAAGLGVLGWLLFFPGIWGAAGAGALAGICAVLACGLVFLAGGPRPAGETWAWPTPLQWLLVACAAAALVFDLAEALSPPADADSLAYHFALPKQFLAAGRIEFVPRAGDGAVPMLVHMSYLAALATGGERALTLWTMASGWAVAGFLYVACRRHLDRTWSLAAALLCVTAPALVYGAGAGQVEARLGLFALGAALAAAEALRSGRIAHAVLAGLLAGFFAGGKLTGLLFLPALGCVFFLSRRWLALGAAFSAAALVAGAQWYAWNYANSGDPVFPVLFSALGLPDSEIWNAAHDAYFRSIYFMAENPIPRTLWKYLTYPLIATFGLVTEIEARRTGLGPAFLLLLPFALAGVWLSRAPLRESPLTVPALSSLLFYTVWFFSGTSQRVRHLVPIYPAIVLCLVIGAARLAQRRPGMAPPIAAAVAATLAVQLAGHAVFSASYLRHVASGEDREAFLRRTVSYYAPVPWINANLTPQDKILLDQRQLVYLIDKPVFYAHYLSQAVIEVSGVAQDPKKFLGQLAAQGVTHILIPVPPQATGQDAPGAVNAVIDALDRAGCLRTVATFEVKPMGSRTLAFLSGDGPTGRMRIAAINQSNCRQ